MPPKGKKAQAAKEPAAPPPPAPAEPAVEEESDGEPTLLPPPPNDMTFKKIEILDPDGFKADPTNLTVVLHEEDHTIGNALKHIMCQMEGVQFCGYNVPHPLEDKILLRVQTYEGKNAKELLLKAFDHLEQVFATIRSKFEAEMA